MEDIEGMTKTAPPDWRKLLRKRVFNETNGPVVSKWISSSIFVFAVAMSHVADSARAADFKINPQAARFVLAIVLDDFQTAQTGGAYMFSYAPNESEGSLRMKVERWLSGHDPEALDMDASERQTLFKFYWAAQHDAEALDMLCADGIGVMPARVDQMDVA